ncbi:hypothetical protein ILUMI_05713 [Ignelater luminosus]|uniref:Uncharacterized protein n=1 Tax=Ignelater luminosus TaxID=2038154 RepID=A0A8K0D6S4_IGNLU|nr:hypothetical protein ILUMI_05713 [Ignelater luminosus]
MSGCDSGSTMVTDSPGLGGTAQSLRPPSRRPSSGQSLVPSWWYFSGYVYLVGSAFQPPKNLDKDMIGIYLRWLQTGYFNTPSFYQGLILRYKCEETSIFQSDSEILPVIGSTIAAARKEDKNMLHLYRIENGCILQENRVIIPRSLQTKILKELRCAHFGENEIHDSELSLLEMN